METDGTSGSDTVQRDFFAKVPEDLEVDLLDLEAALIFERATRPAEDADRSRRRCDVKEQAGSGRTVSGPDKTLGEQTEPDAEDDQHGRHR